MLTLLEGADAELEQARRGYRDLSRALVRWCFLEPPCTTLERLDLLAEGARRRFACALPRLSPRDARHATQLAQQVDASRRRVVDAATYCARRLGFEPAATSTPELLDTLYEAPAPTGLPGRLTLRLVVAALALCASFWMMTLLPLAVIAIALPVMLVGTAVIRRRRWRYPATALAVIAALSLPFLAILFIATGPCC